jgi:hypothetical protein
VARETMRRGGGGGASPCYLLCLSYPMMIIYTSRRLTKTYSLRGLQQTCRAIIALLDWRLMMLAGVRTHQHVSRRYAAPGHDHEATKEPRNQQDRYCTLQPWPRQQRQRGSRIF